jgi:hypothetical protein
MAAPGFWLIAGSRPPPLQLLVNYLDNPSLLYVSQCMPPFGVIVATALGGRGNTVLYFLIKTA